MKKKQKVDYETDPEHIARRLRVRDAMREAKIESAAELCRMASLQYDTFKAGMNGRRGISIESCMAIAPVLGKRWEALYSGGDMQEIPRQKPLARAELSANSETSVLPRYRAAISPSGGRVLFSLGPDGTISGPASLINVQDAYAAYVPDSIMEPRYEAGEIIHVNPGRPVRAGCYVVWRPNGGGDGFIRKFVGIEDGKYILATLNPPTTESHDASECSLHRIVGSAES